MFGFRAARKKAAAAQAAEALNHEAEAGELTASLDANIALLRELFRDDDTMQFRPFLGGRGGKLSFCAVFCDGLVNSDAINEHVIKPLMLLEALPEGGEVAEHLMNRVVWVNSAAPVVRVGEIIPALTYGDTLLLTEGAKTALLLNTKGFETRSISEPDGEKILNGPREGFTEALLKNLSMVRRKLRTNALKMKFMPVGRRSGTQVCVAYIDGIMDKKILGELFTRLEAIDTDAVLDENYLTERIRDNPRSPFRATGLTERPDVVVGKLLEGRAAVFIDGTPSVMTVPYLFIENFQNCEDYYMSFFGTSFSRLLRILGFILTVCVPAVYITVEAFHQEILPASMMINIAIERQSVPLPAALEAFLLLLMFDILQEAGMRMPSGIGQSLSIVGALVVGSAAVEASLISAPMIIVLAITGISGLLIPKMKAPLIFARTGLLILASLGGFFGLSLGLAVLLIHILGLKSFGISQMTADRDLGLRDVKDTFIRAPWWKMRTRPVSLTDNATRSK